MAEEVKYLLTESEVRELIKESFASGYYAKESNHYYSNDEECRKAELHAWHEVAMMTLEIKKVLD